MLIRKPKKIIDPAFLDHARKVARQSVMLKNEGNALPLSENIGSVAVIGPLADAPRDQLGTWCFDGQGENSVTPLRAVRELLGERKVNYVAGLSYSRDKSPDQFNAAVAAARSQMPYSFSEAKNGSCLERARAGVRLTSRVHRAHSSRHWLLPASLLWW